MTTKTKSIFDFGSDSITYPQFKYLGYAGMIAGIITVFDNLYVGLGIIFLSFIFSSFFSSKRTKLDIENKIIRTYTDFRTIKTTSFNHISSFYINAKKISQKMNSRGSSNVIKYTLYQGFVKADNSSFLLIEDRDKDKVAESLTEVASLAGVKFSDNT